MRAVRSLLGELRSLTGWRAVRSLLGELKECDRVESCKDFVRRIVRSLIE